MWQLEQTRAQLTAGDLRVGVDVLRADRGLDVAIFGNKLAGRFLEIHLPPVENSGDERVTDCYARNDDLVATYTDARLGNVRPQIYWRAIAGSGGAVGVEAIVSVQTNLLDSRPVVSTATELFAAADVRQLASLEDERFENIAPSLNSVSTEPSRNPAAFLFRLADQPLAYFEMAFPGDCYSASLEFPQSRETARLSFALLGEPLEKGVIRRVRVRGLFLTGDNLEATAARCFREFLAAPLPLTT